MYHAQKDNRNLEGVFKMVEAEILANNWVFVGHRHIITLVLAGTEGMRRDITTTSYWKRLI